MYSNTMCLKEVNLLRINKELLKGSTSTMVLKIISEGDIYGYRIAQRLTEKSSGAFQLKEGTLYPILHSLEGEGYITSYKTIESGRERKYYKITVLGVTKLNGMIEEWNVFSKCVSNVLEECIQ